MEITELAISFISLLFKNINIGFIIFQKIDTSSSRWNLNIWFAQLCVHVIIWILKLRKNKALLSIQLDHTFLLIHIYIYILSLRVFTIVFIFIVIFTMFQSICPLAFFRCLSNSGTFTELQTTCFIESTGVACSVSVSHNQVQVLSIPVLLLACSEDWTCNLQMIISFRSLGNQPLHYVSCCTIQSEFLGHINLMFLLD